MSVLRGTVTQLGDDGRPLVEVPDLAPGFVFGPLDVSVTVELQVGDRVVVSPVGDILDDLIVTGVLGAQDRGGSGGGGSDPDPDPGPDPTPGAAPFKVSTEEFTAAALGDQTLTLAHPPNQVFLVTWSSVPQPTSEFTVAGSVVTLHDPLSLILVGDRLTVTYAHPVPAP